MDFDLRANWNNFVEKKKGQAYEKIDEFLTDLEHRYKAEKIEEFERAGANHNDAVVKARQSWVVYVGKSLERIVEMIIEPLVVQHGAKMASDKEIKKRALGKEMDCVRRAILVHFDGSSQLPDADLIVYRYDEKIEKVFIVAILSMKNSFRERYTETPYWKLKLMQSEITRGIKVYMVTTDRDDEISSSTRPSKARVVLEYELDGVYITKNKNEFGATDKVGDINALLKDLKELLVR